MGLGGGGGPCLGDDGVLFQRGVDLVLEGLLLLWGDRFAPGVGLEAGRRVGALCGGLRGLGLEAAVGEQDGNGRDVLGHGAVVWTARGSHARAEDGGRGAGGSAGDEHCTGVLGAWVV